MAERCEVCGSEGFVSKFCEAVGGDAECKEMAAEAAAGRMSQEEYFAYVLRKYGRARVDLAMTQAMLAIETDALDTVQRPELPPAGVVEEEGSDDVPYEELSDAQYNEGQQYEEPSTPQEDIGDIADELCRIQSSIKGLCIPCVRDPIQAVLQVVAMWYTGKDKEALENCIDRMARCDGNVEDILKDAFLIKDVDTNLNIVLADINKVLTMATEMALKENPSLAREV